MNSKYPLLKIHLVFLKHNLISGEHNKRVFLSSKKLVNLPLSYFSHVQFFEIWWTVSHQAPLSMGFSRQEYWSELTFPPLEDFPPGVKPTSPVFPARQVNSLPAKPSGKPWDVWFSLINRNLWIFWLSWLLPYIFRTVPQSWETVSWA